VANLYAKFEVSSFSPSRDMEEVPKFTHSLTHSLTQSLTDAQTDFIICPMLLMHWADNDEVGTMSPVQSETHHCKTCTDIFAVPDLMSERPEFQANKRALEQFSVSGSTKTGKRKKLREEISTYVQVHWLARRLHETEIGNTS